MLFKGERDKIIMKPDIIHEEYSEPLSTWLKYQDYNVFIIDLFSTQESDMKILQRLHTPL